jgi:hypothetical protein
MFALDHFFLEFVIITHVVAKRKENLVAPMRDAYREGLIKLQCVL